MPKGKMSLSICLPHSDVHKMIRFVLLLAAVLSIHAKAAAPLQPSDVARGDCVAARITAAKQGIAFFTDRCSASDYFIGLGGVTHTLQRVRPAPKGRVAFEGRYEGDGVQVEIAVLEKGVGQCEVLTQSEMDSLNLAGERKVAVRVSRGAETVRILGTYDDCP
ncbi:hypothetical protein [Massilia sp. CF038]|uniref:hypothetical protein n=1 Tax=Massilia sp. CF038 TaxID=1881045 RepID=UPI0011610FF9|nr:hypothetical protein [Massilia sp. CF038]